MTRNVSMLDMRRCIRFYVPKRVGLDIGSEQRRPHDQHVVVLRCDAVLAVLADGRNAVSAE